MIQNQFTDEKIWNYCIETSTEISSDLENITKETVDTLHGAHMLSEKMVTKFLQFFAYGLDAKICVDVGTYSGMSAVAMAEIVSEDAVIYTIDRKPQVGAPIAKKYLAKYKNVEIIIDEALNALPKLPNNIDLAFIDADKKSIREYFDILIDKMSHKGIIIVDDVLWRGNVVNPEDKLSKIFDDFNRYIYSRDDLDNIVLPLRHGINVIRKK
jgi:predicted O-methyltransferase YrrM